MKKIIAFIIGFAMSLSVAAENLKIIVPFSAGGAFDGMARQYSLYLEKDKKANVSVENVTGAGSILGTNRFLSDPSENILFFTSSSFFVNIVENGFVYQDFEPVAIIGTVPFIYVVNKDKNINCSNFKHQHIFVAHAGIHSSTSIPSMILKRNFNNITEVSYRGISQSVLDVIAGHVDSTFIGGLTHSNKELVHLFNTSRESYKGVPSWKECIGIQEDIKTEFVVVARKGASKEFIQKHNLNILRFINDPATIEYFNKNGYSFTATDLEKTRSEFRSSLNKWYRVYNK